jgi:cytidylate kinase
LSKPATIAIDGSAASGKSTLGARLAQRLGYLYFDTGVMYRAVTWAVLDRKIDPENVETVSELAENLLIEVKPNGPQDGRLYTVLADGQDITWQIRSPEVETYVSLISSYSRVRSALTAQQRRIAAAGSIVMVGRDIGTVVLRYHEILAQGKSANFEEILMAIRERDKQDREKPISPMLPAPDAVIIETDNLSLEAVLAHLEQLIATEKTVG